MRRGLYAALPTFLHPDETLDLAAYAAHVVRLAEAGVDGVLVAGSSGEFPALDEAERRLLAETAVQAADRRLAVAVHVGAGSTAATLCLARHAAAAGADALAVVTPFYLRTDDAGLRDLLTSVKEAAPDRPLLAYSMPRLAGSEFPVALVAELASAGVLAGVKESGESLSRMLLLRERCGPDFAVLTGAPALHAAALAHGLDGAILGVVNAAPVEWAELARRAGQGDLRGAAELGTRLAPVAAACGLGTFPAGLKAIVAERFGTPATVRRPRRPLDEGEVGTMREALRRAGLGALAAAG
jgi:dihydrodipicolinate synthase/N-acetylneuraminate lyase